MSTQKDVCNTPSEFEAAIPAKTSRRPAFRGQTVVDAPGHYPLDTAGNSVVVLHGVLGAAERAAYIAKATAVQRASGWSGYGMKPRLELCYSTTGKPFNYSNVNHTTVAYPDHVAALLPPLAERIDEELRRATGAGNTFTELSTGVDICYDKTFPRGGSVAAHKDNTDPNWGMVLIFSLGQTRYLRVRRDSDRSFFNIVMPDNSVVAMHGASFQKEYTHQVDKLYADEEIWPRLSLNARYL